MRWLCLLVDIQEFHKGSVKGSIRGLGFGSGSRLIAALGFWTWAALVFAFEAGTTVAMKEPIETLKGFLLNSIGSYLYSSTEPSIEPSRNPALASFRRPY